MAFLDFPSSPSVNDTFTQNGRKYIWDGVSWRNNNSGPLGYTGSKGDIGYAGSQGIYGTVTTSVTPPGSPLDGDLWWNEEDGQLKIFYNDGDGAGQWVDTSAGGTGPVGYTGSKGDLGYSGSVGFAGSVGSLGYTGSKGDTGSTGFTGSVGGTGYTGSATNTITAAEDNSSAITYPVFVTGTGAGQTANIDTGQLIYRPTVGHLGIGISPTSNLHVQGNANISGNVIFGSNIIVESLAGANGQVLVSQGGKGARWSSSPAVRTINIVIDGGGSVITTGNKADIVVDVTGTINTWTLVTDVSGNLNVNVLKATYANYPTFTASGGSSPNVILAQKNQSAINWTGFTTITAGDILRCNISGTPASVTRATLALKVTTTA